MDDKIKNVIMFYGLVDLCGSVFGSDSPLVRYGPFYRNPAEEGTEETEIITDGSIPGGNTIYFINLSVWI